jgi:hypothetical protein
MKTYFIEIVYNKDDQYTNKSEYLRCYVQADSPEDAKKQATDHYAPICPISESGVFKVQCCWVVNVPKREVFEELWEKVTRSYFPKAVHAGSGLGAIGYKKVYLDETKKDVLSTWDDCNAEWASSPVYYNPSKACYIVQIHNHMNMPCNLIEFEGNTKEVYDAAMQWVEENTFKGEYFRKPSST